MKLSRTIIALVALLFVGCIDYTETLSLNADGSGTVSLQYKLANSFFDQSAKFTQEMTGEETGELDPTEGMLEKQEIERKLEESNSGIELLSYDKSRTEDAWVWDMKFKFKDVNKLYLLGAATSIDDQSDQDEFSSIESEPVYTKQTDGTWLFLRSVESEDESSDWNTSVDGDLDSDEFDEDHNYDTEEDFESSNEQNLSENDGDAGEMLGDFAEQLKNLEKEMAKHRIRFAVTFPGAIVESNATSIEGNTAVWEYRLNEMANVTDGMRAVIRP